MAGLLNWVTNIYVMLGLADRPAAGCSPDQVACCLFLGRFCRLLREGAGPRSSVRRPSINALHFPCGWGVLQSTSACEALRASRAAPLLPSSTSTAAVLAPS